MRRFYVIRDEDVSGTSGTGLICEGFQASNGKVSLHWLGAYPSTTVWDSMEQATHIHGHGGLTRMVWLDDEEGNQRPTADVRAECALAQSKSKPVNRLAASGTDDGRRFVVRRGSRMSDGSILLDNGTVLLDDGTVL